MKPNCVTNAGQKIKVTASARVPRGDAKFFSIYRKRNGTTMIRTYGAKLRLTITWSAAATGTTRRTSTAAPRRPRMHTPRQADEPPLVEERLGWVPIAWQAGRTV